MGFTVRKQGSKPYFAVVVCDGCGAELNAGRPNRWSKHECSDGPGSTRIPMEGLENQASKRAAENGWKKKGKDHFQCPSCTNKRRDGAKEKNETQDMDNKMNLKVTTQTATSPSEEPPRQPSREVKRKIRALLDDVYDVAAGRYRGDETDQSVAEAIGDGCLWGWVRIERELGYGDGHANEAMDSKDDELTEILSKLDQNKAEMDRLKQEAASLSMMIATCIQDTEKLKQDVARIQNDISHLKAPPKRITKTW